MAATFKTESPPTRNLKKKKKNSTLAPSLLFTKSQENPTQQLNKIPKTARRRPTKLISSSSSSSSGDSDASSGSTCSHNLQAPPSSEGGSKWRQRCPSGLKKRQQRKKPVELPSLSSDASSVSSLTSSDGQSLPRTSVKKKKLVRNDRVLQRNKVYFSGQQVKRGDSANGQCSENQKSRKVLESVHAKRKRVVRESSDITKKRVRTPGDHKKKKRKTVAPLSQEFRSDSSSPVFLPQPVPSRKSNAALYAASQQETRGRAGATDAFRRYRCRKSVSTASTSTHSRTVVPSPASKMSENVLSSPSPSPLSRKKRRVFTYFNTDQVALDDLQAQERELAWIRSQHKQTQVRSHLPKPAAQKQKTSRDVIPVSSHLHADRADDLKDIRDNDEQQNQTKAKMKTSATLAQISPVISCNAMVHPTSYRGVFFGEAPTNILSQTGKTCTEPFVSICDCPLTFYDETNKLASHCAISNTFGKLNQCISSVFPSEMAKPQSDVNRSVRSLVTANLPIIRRCHRRKVKAILSEARQKISSYQASLNDHMRAYRSQKVMTSHLFSRSAAEKHTARQLKTVKHTCSMNAQRLSFQIGRGNDFIREKTVSSLIQINYIDKVRSLRKYTTSIGLRANIRVEDDPILRYTTTNGIDRANGGEELMKKYGLRIGNVADEEVAEYVLRLVVGRLGDSEQVFHALKVELGFSQANTTYSELTKLHDSRQRATSRLCRVESLGRDDKRASDPDVVAIVNLMEQSSLSTASHAKVLSRRLQPPLRNLESTILDNLMSDATARMGTLGLRATDSYNELVDVYCGSFCRMCYKYACHDHSGDHPLPVRRVDPVYPRVWSAGRGAGSVECNQGAHFSAGSVDDASSDMGSDVKKVRRTDTTANAHSAACRETPLSCVEVKSDVTMSGTVLLQQQHNPIADPSEYIDISHVSFVTAKIHSFLSTRSACGKECWKNCNSIGTIDQQHGLQSSELGIIRKLRQTIGDNSCVLAAVVGSISCSKLHEAITKEQVNSEPGGVGDGTGRSCRRRCNWKQVLRPSGSNHQLLQRTRNQRLKDRGTENHEYQPCMHAGLCDSTGCSCMNRDHMCEKACACSRDCPNRFEGCSCSPGECRTNKCSCFAALRECDPDVCVSCGASELAVAVSIAGIVGVSNSCFSTTCGNVNVIRSKHKMLGMGFSSIHGYGVYAREPIVANEFVYEYTGAMLSQDEAERRGRIYEMMEMSYVFDLNEDAVLDALRRGNKSKFINHQGEKPNCTAKVTSVCGVHHITIWALHDIAVGDELFLDYGYKRGIAQTGDTAEMRCRTPERVL